MQDLPKNFLTTQNGKVRPGRREPFELLRNSHAGGGDGCTGRTLLESSTRDRRLLPQERPYRPMSTFRRFAPGRREDSDFLRNTHAAFEARFDFSILCSSLEIGTWDDGAVPQECTTVGLAPHPCGRCPSTTRKRTDFRQSAIRIVFFRLYRFLIFRRWSSNPFKSSVDNSYISYQ